MIKRLIEIRRELNELLAGMNIGSLLSGDWAKLEELAALSEPFQTHTDNLQSSSLSLSNVVPTILDLECHLVQFPHAKNLTGSMVTNFTERFESVCCPSHHGLNPVPAAACLLDPSCASFILLSVEPFFS
jgi:hypothetical protein